jgi:photosystem II stability/assembly factor-like uncharacterized protein
MRVYLLLALIGVTAQFSRAQWIQQSGGTPENLVDVIMLDSMNALAIGDRNGILRTTDAGTTWINESAVVSAVYRWNNISFFDALNGTIVGDHRIMTTTDGGFTWLNRSVPSTRKCLSVLQTGSADIYVGADSGWIYHTIDTGKTWTTEKVSQWSIRSLFAWTGAYIFGLPIFALTPFSLCESRIFSSGSWQESILKNFEGLGSEAFKGTICYGGGSSFIVGVQGDLRAAPAIIRKKQMSDTVWTGVSQGILHDGTFYGISAPSTNTIYVCGDGGVLFKSTNGGDTWNSFTGLTSRSLKAIFFFDVNHGFAVGDSGTILHTDNGGGVFVDVGKEPGPAPKEFLLDQNYPNPFNPVTVISYQLAVNSFVTVRVYDLLGREAAMLVNEEKSAGSYTLRWDATHFASGVYFYRLQAGVFSDTKKLLLLK